ncbi:cytochrome P450 [Mycena polygramma]|nr:cytochrome P450 [Mycena polygramma]
MISFTQYAKLFQVFVPIASGLLCYILIYASRIAYRNLTSPLRHLRGPKNPSFLLGNFQEMADDALLTGEWRKEFGRTFLYKSLFSINELHTSDITALSHIFTHSLVYQKAPSTIVNSEILLGTGLLSVELDEHKRHRKIMNPAFGVAQIRLMTSIFVDKALQLRDIWALEVEKQNGSARINVSTWLRRVTLDIIGKAGFDYEFDSLQPSGKPNELNEVLSQLLHSPEANRYATFRHSQGLLPILRFMPGPGWNLTLAAKRKMISIASRLVSGTKADIKVPEDGIPFRDKRDLLTLLLKANMSAAVPQEQRLSEDEVIAQIPTFLFAGHETTSSAMAWALFVLSENTAVQNKLRDELLTIPRDDPTMDELNSLPYLESVIREFMRLHPPVVFTHRMAVEDDVLPLSKPCVDREGKTHSTLLVPKGQMIHIPILAVNTDRDIWGEDATEFKPERWEKIPDAASAIPGVWAHLMTFLAGPHNCIGFRFSLAELKALLFTLVRAFEFEPALPKGAIGPAMTRFQQRPIELAGGAGKGIPLILKAYNRQV